MKRETEPSEAATGQENLKSNYWRDYGGLFIRALVGTHPGDSWIPDTEFPKGQESHSILP